MITLLAVLPLKQLNLTCVLTFSRLIMSDGPAFAVAKNVLVAVATGFIKAKIENPVVKSVN